MSVAVRRAAAGVALELTGEWSAREFAALDAELAQHADRHQIDDIDVDAEA